MEQSRGRKKTFNKSTGSRRKSSEGKFSTSNKRKEIATKPTKSAAPKKETTQKKSSDNTTRLNKYIAHAGICSRREADGFITAGVVQVNGEIITEMGYQVKPGDEVKFNDRRLNTERKVYILINKPKDVTATVEEKSKSKTVMDLLANACKERVYPVGSIDKKTTGVLLLTNDGDLTKRLTNTKYVRKKIYHVQLDKTLKGSDFEKITDGVELEDGFIKPNEISFIDPSDQKEIGIEIQSGKNRIVRRIFEHLGYKVQKLDRVYYAGLTKKNLPRGKWRFLSEKEINFLKMS